MIQSSSREMPHEKILFAKHDQIQLYTEGSFSTNAASEYSKCRSGAIVPISLLTLHTIKLSDHLSPDEEQTQVEIRMFEEQNLQKDQNYTIAYVRNPLASESGVLCEVYALCDEKAQDYFADVLKDISTIDLVIPGFMVYETLYKTLPKQNDLFLYWGEEEAYAVIYQDGRYIAHRTIETLTTMAVEIGLDLAKLRLFLTQKGLIEENYQPEELNKFILLQERLAKNIERIVHTINHKRGLFGLTSIEHVYIDLEGKTIPGLENVFKAYGVDDLTITPLHSSAADPKEYHDLLCAEYLRTHIEKPVFNLSPFERTLPWFRRPGGIFFGAVASALVLSLLSPLVIYAMIASETSHQEELKSQLSSLEKETLSLAKTLKIRNTVLTEKKENTRILGNEISMINSARETADLVHEMQVKRQQFLVDSAVQMGQYHLGALLIEQNSSKAMRLHVIADSNRRDDIAKLMNGLYEQGYTDVQTQEIKLENGTYNSIIEVKR